MSISMKVIRLSSTFAAKHFMRKGACFKSRCVQIIQIEAGTSHIKHLTSNESWFPFLSRSMIIVRDILIF